MLLVVTIFVAVAVGCGQAVALPTATDPIARARVATQATLRAFGSVGQANVVEAEPGAKLRLLDERGDSIARGRADGFGSFVFYGVKPGRGYRVSHGPRSVTSEPFAVLDGSVAPDPSLYTSQKLMAGLNYVRMRDGVELAMVVRLPTGKTMADGPFPTVLEISGNQAAAPNSMIDDVAAQRLDPARRADPLAPDSSMVVGSLLAPLLGFTSVSVQMRGTGCSGGAFDLFGLPTTYDGYDAVEIVAAQQFVKGNKVGLVGLSYSGIAQFYVAGTRPPHLAAMAAMSVTDDLYREPGFPGGMFNTGFAKTWLEERVENARAAPGGGLPYARELVKRGDQRCKENQRLHGQAVDVFAVLRSNPYRTKAVYEPRSAAAWARKISVPVFLVGAFQDEQTGGHWPDMIRLLPSDDVWVSIVGGTHVDSLGPATLTRWFEFLKLFVADEIPVVPAGLLAESKVFYDALADSPAAPIEQSRFAGMSDVVAARGVFTSDPRVTVYMDNGAGSEGKGAMQPTWKMSFASWPPVEVEPTSFYLGSRGALRRTPPRVKGSDRYRSDPLVRPIQTLDSQVASDAWAAQPDYRWMPIVRGNGLGYVTAKLRDDLVVMGPSSLSLYVRSSAPDTDLQVTLSEVRPDGKETYVQSGWLRASHRTLLPGVSTLLQAVPSHERRDSKKLPGGVYTLVRVPLDPVGHVFRAGSRLRVTLAAPGGDRPSWRFQTIEEGTTVNTIARSPAFPSRLTLPILPGVKAQGGLPACDALRGQPCRNYRRASNGG